MNKRRQRTEVLIQATARRRMAEQADNAVEQHNVETLLVNAEPGTGDKQLKDYYEKHREAGLRKRQNPPRRPWRL